jgi:NhaA family Na+:H+ antiporter
VILRLRNRRYKRMYEEEKRDVDRDGIPDAWDTVDDRAAHEPDWEGTPPPGRTEPPSAES